MISVTTLLCGGASQLVLFFLEYHYFYDNVIYFQNKEDQMLFCQSGGLTSLSRLLLLYSDPSSVSSRALLASLPEKYDV